MAQNENISLSLANLIDILNKAQSVDLRYGVYDTEEDALDAMALYGLDGRQVAVYSDKVNGKVKLYLYNQVEHKLEPGGDIEAIDVSYDDTTTQLGVDNTQEAIETIVRRGILKLEESLVFEVGYDKQFTSISSAVDKALEYYPNLDYKITILIDEAFEVGESLHYTGLDLSHIVFTTIGEIILTTTPTAVGSANPVFYFNSCWLPAFNNFKIINSDSLTTSNIVGLRTAACTSGHITNSEWLKFSTCLWFEQTSNFYIENSTVKPFRNTTIRRGVRMQNSHIDIRSINVDTYSDDVYVDSTQNVAIESSSSSTLHIRQQGGVTAINGSFNIGIKIDSGSQVTLTGITEFNIDGEYDVRLNGGNFYNAVGAPIGNDIIVNIPYNIITKSGFALKTSKPIPYSFDGTDYILDYIKADEGEEFIVTVDEDGKLKSEAKTTKTSELTNDSGFITSSDLSRSSEIPSGSPTLTTPSQVNVYYFSGSALKDFILPKPSEASGKEIIIINKGTANAIGHSWDNSPSILILNKLDFAQQSETKPNNIGKFISDGSIWAYETVNNFESIAVEGKTVVMTVLPDGTPQAEETQELWVYDDTLTGYDLADLQETYPTSSGHMQGFEVRCRLMTPPTTYRKESENDSQWIKTEHTNVT